MEMEKEKEKEKKLEATQSSIEGFCLLKHKEIK
jgi:hypothetical protein